MTLRFLLRLALLSCLILWLALSSGCSMTPAVLQPHFQKPTTCLQPLPTHLLLLTDEFNQLAQKRNDLAANLYARFVALSPRDRDDALAEIMGLDNRLAQILAEMHAADGNAYHSAITELGDCQAFIRSLP